MTASGTNVLSPFKTESSQPASLDLWQSIRKMMELQNHAPPLQRVPRDQLLPISFAQEQLWWLDRLRPGDPAYNIPFAFELNGLLHIPALEQSFTEILKRHESLRTAIALVNEQPIQVIREATSFKLSVIDLQALSDSEQEARTSHILQDEASKPFDLGQAPMLRATVLQQSETKSVLLLTVHHIAFDGWSEGLLWQELATLYEAFAAGESSPLPDLPLQYADFAVWQRQWLQGDALDAHLSYWRPKLEGLVAPQLPYDFAPPRTPTRPSDRQTLRLSKELTQALKQFSRQQRSTLFTTLLAAFKVLLHGYTGQEDLFVCTPAANRNQAATKPLMGYFVNLLILRSDLSGDPTFLDVLKRVHQVSSAAFAYQTLPLQQLVTAIDMTRVPLSRVMFVLQNMPRQVPQLAGLDVTALDSDSGTADFDLSLSFVDEAGHLAGVVKYDRELFQDNTISQLLQAFEALLQAIATAPDQSLSALLSSLGIERSSPPQLHPSISDATLDRADSATTRPEYVAPRNLLERELVQIWEQVLGIQPIGVTESFFDLGGSSLLAAKLFTQVQQTCGSNLTLDTLFKASTIETLAQLLQNHPDSGTHSYLVPIRASGDKAPLFCIPAAGASAFHFSRMVRYSNSNRPFYGIQARGLDGQDDPHTHIPEMAADYIQAIRGVQPEGPYYLSGHCFGGLVAFEMACQLQQQGDEVAMLALFDADSPTRFRKKLTTVKPKPSLRDRLNRNISALLRQGPQYVHKKWQEWNKNLIKRRHELTSQVYQKAGLPVPHEVRHVPILKAANQAIRDYQPQGIYSGQLILFKATNQDVAGGVSYDTQTSWGKFATQGAKIYEVAGNHHSMFHEPHIQALAQAVEACLDS